MLNRQLGNVVDYIRHIAACPRHANHSDGQLLRRFIELGDERAFAVLVERHGALVLGVCQRLLHDVHAAEDVFQATFLVLARKAWSIRNRESLASWLYGVAYRIARKARGKAAQERSKIMPLESISIAANEDKELLWRDLRPLIDDELNQLPAKYRDPIVLCYLEGLSNSEAATQLGCTKGTVSGRLARARDLLRGRLVRRGLSLTPAVLAALLCERGAAMTVPASLTTDAVRTASTVLAGSMLAGTVATQVNLLAQGVIHTMIANKIKTMGAILLSVCLLGGGGAALTTHVLSGGSALASVTDGLEEQRVRATTDRELLQGTWKAVSAQRNGVDISDEVAGQIKLTFTGDNIIIELPQRSEGPGKGSYELDPDANPKQIDIDLTGKKDRGLGIYQLVDDRLMLCMDDASKERPKSFETPEGSGNMLIVFERVGQPRVQRGGRQQLEIERLRAENAVLRQELERTRNDLIIAKSQLELLKRSGRFSKDEIDALTLKAANDAFANLAKFQNQLAEKKGSPNAQEAAQRARSANNLKQIGIAFHNYHDTYKNFPPAAIYSKDGKPLLSWRVALLPYLNQDNLYRQFKLDEPWDSPHNKRLLDRMPKMYAPVRGEYRKGHTYYQVFTGPKTVFDGSRGIKIQEITDGTSNTALVFEAGEAVPWTKPQDMPYNAAKLPKLGGLGFTNGFHVLMGDGSVRFLPFNTQTEILQSFILPADGRFSEGAPAVPAGGVIRN